MNGRQQMRELCGRHREVVRENRLLRAELSRARLEIAELDETITNLRVERDAADALFGEAMDAALEHA